MAAAEAHLPEVDDGEGSFAQRAEELFDTLATDGALHTDSAAALVAAVTFLGLEVTEER